MSGPEYEHIENKQSLGERHEATVAIAAFATARGGTVRFGIAPDGRRIGVLLGRTTLEEQGLPRPKFTCDGGMFVVKFLSPPANTTRENQHPISERMVAALAHMTTVGAMTSRQYAQRFDISERQALRDLSDLIRTGKVVRKGKGPSTKYVSTY